MEDTLFLPCSPFTDGLVEDLPLPSPAETVLYNENADKIPSVSTETVSEVSSPIPILMAKSVTVDPTPSPEPEIVYAQTEVAKPKPPTAAVKCPRKQKKIRPRKVRELHPLPGSRRRASMLCKKFASGK